MEHNKISIHEARMFLALEKRNGQWATSMDLAAEAGIAERTARAHASKLVKLGILDVAKVFPAHRYRLASNAGKPNTSYLIRLRNAVDIFGLK